jgi:hypothetical protein
MGCHRTRYGAAHAVALWNPRSANDENVPRQYRMERVRIPAVDRFVTAGTVVF